SAAPIPGAPAAEALSPAADPLPEGQTTGAPAGEPAAVPGQRVEQAPPPVLRPKPLPEIPAPASPATTEAKVPAAPEIAVVEAGPTPEPPPPIAAVFKCRRGAEFRVDPEEVLVTVDGQLLGKADDWDGAGGGKAYIFPAEGDHLVKLALTGFRSVWVKVVVTPSAKRDIVAIDTELEEIE
ncbi:MAG: hypothetical protein ABIV06_13065, partial [Thermoanaerobaculia bacterium]